jgi:hypothetical protein
LFALLLAGCDQKAFLQRFVPSDDDAFARRFLDSVRAADYTAAEQMLDTSLREDKGRSGLHELNGVLAHGDPLSVEVIGCNVFSNASTQGTTRTTNLSYQIHFAHSWAVGNVAVGHTSRGVSVLASQFQTVPDSLETLNRFTFANKSVVHYLVFAACVIIPALILVALVTCIRSRIRRKWLWIIFILFGFVQFRFDWASGHFDVQPVSISLFGASAVRPSPYAPWILAFAIPAGAIIFLAFRRRLLLNDAAQEA